MGIGASIFLIALGAILAFAVEFDLAGLDINVVGWILMAAGLAGLLITLVYSRRRSATVATDADGQVVHRSHSVSQEPPV